MPHHDHPSPPHWFINDEKEMSLPDIASRFITIGTILKQKKKLILKTPEDTVEVTPPDLCLSILRFERMPHGALKFKLEFEWSERKKGHTPSNPTVVEIE